MLYYQKYQVNPSRIEPQDGGRAYLRNVLSRGGHERERIMLNKRIWGRFRHMGGLDLVSSGARIQTASNLGEQTLLRLVEPLISQELYDLIESVAILCRPVCHVVLLQQRPSCVIRHGHQSRLSLTRKAASSKVKARETTTATQRGLLT